MTDTDRPGFRAALSNRMIQMTLGALALTAASAGTALFLQGSAVAPADTVANRAAIEKIVHDYILANPEIIPQAVEKLQAKRTGALIEANRAAIETPFAGAWEGNEKGDVVLVEFFDYACGYCRASLPDLARLVANDKGLKIVYRELPIITEQSADAAKISLLAAEKGVYMPFHRALYAAGQVTRENALASAVKAGIDRKAAEAALTNPRYAAEIESNISLAQKMQVQATPTFVVGDQILSGALGYDALKKAVDDARAK